MNNEQKPLRMAIIGAGFISYSHFFASRDIPAIEAVAMASNSKKTANHRGRIFGLPSYTFDRLEEMVDREKPDLAVIASPSACHADQAVAVLKKGCHVVIEKPLAIRLSEVKRIREAAESSKAQVGYAENQTFCPLVTKMRELIEAGEIGDVKKITSSFVHSGPPRGTWFYRKELAGGGARMDVGPHPIEISLGLAGSPEVARVKSASVTLDDSCGLDAVTECTLETDNNIEIESTSSWRAPEIEFTYRLEGSDGTMDALFSNDMNSHRLAVKSKKGRKKEIEVIPGFRGTVSQLIGKGGYTGQLRHFEECFRSGKVPIEGLAEGERVLRVTCGIYAAAGSGSPFDMKTDIPGDRMAIEFFTG